MKTIFIAHKNIGRGSPVFVIAEAGVNHNGSLRLAKKLVDAAARAGADAVKFQTFCAEKLVTRESPLAPYQKKKGVRSQYQMLKPLELPQYEFTELFRYAQKKKIIFLSTPFDEGSADFLFRLGVRAFKIGSGELTNLPLLAHLAQKKLPVILSTGMATLQEVKEAVDTLRKSGLKDMILLHCVSSYPAPVEDCNLRAIRTMDETFHVPCGFSDHTTGFEASCAAVALGACCIEKHFTIDKSLPGPDHKMSLLPVELSEFVRAIRNVEKALGDGTKKPATCELPVKKAARKSIVASRGILKGERMTKNMLCMKRPETGILPRDIKKVLTKKARKNIPADTVLQWSILK